MKTIKKQYNEINLGDILFVKLEGIDIKDKVSREVKRINVYDSGIIHLDFMDGYGTAGYPQALLDVAIVD